MSLVLIPRFLFRVKWTGPLLPRFLTVGQPEWRSLVCVNTSCGRGGVVTRPLLMIGRRRRVSSLTRRHRLKWHVFPWGRVSIQAGRWSVNIRLKRPRPRFLVIAFRLTRITHPRSILSGPKLVSLACRRWFHFMGRTIRRFRWGRFLKRTVVVRVG